MFLTASIGLSDPALHGAEGPAEAARRLRQLADEIESDVSDFSACAEGKRIAGSREDCSCIAYLADL